MEVKESKQAASSFIYKHGVKIVLMFLIVVVALFAGTRCSRERQIEKLTEGIWGYGEHKVISFDGNNGVIFHQRFDRVIGIETSEGYVGESFAGKGTYNVRWEFLNSGTIRADKDGQSMDMSFRFEGDKLQLGVGANYTVVLELCK